MNEDAKMAATMSVHFNTREVLQDSDAKFKSPEEDKKCKKPEPVNLSMTISSMDTSTEAGQIPPKKRKYTTWHDKWFQQKSKQNSKHCTKQLTVSSKVSQRPNVNIKVHGEDSGNLSQSESMVAHDSQPSCSNETFGVDSDCSRKKVEVNIDPPSNVDASSEASESTTSPTK